MTEKPKSAPSDRLWLRAARFVWVCSTTGYNTPGLREAVPPGFNPLRRGWVYPPAPQKGECQRGQRYFWNCLIRVGSGSVTGPTLKRPCATFLRWCGHWINLERTSLLTTTCPIKTNQQLWPPAAAAAAAAILKNILLTRVTLLEDDKHSRPTFKRLYNSFRLYIY